MNDEAAFQKAMQEHPEDNSLRLVFADWLEERGDLRGELVRLLHTLTQFIEVPDRGKLEDRMRSLLAAGVQPVGPFTTNSIGMKFAWIPAGTFLMGSPEGEEGRRINETQHTVTLTKGYWLAIHPVTQVVWKEIMGNNPAFRKSDDLPVQRVSWDECQEFLRKLGDQQGQGYRLPTEAQWEYACRAGTTSAFYFGDTISTDQANYNGDYPNGQKKLGLNRDKTTPVGRFPPNSLGLFDMHGNVYEWCADLYENYPSGAVVDPQGAPDGIVRVLRGGSYLYDASNARSAARGNSVPNSRTIRNGFRLARTFG